MGVVDPTKLEPNLCMLCRVMNRKDCVWENFYQIIAKTILQEKETVFYRHYSFWFINLFLCLKFLKIFAAKAGVDKEWDKLDQISAWNLTKDKSKKRVNDEARASGATVHFSSLMDICHIFHH